MSALDFLKATDSAFDDVKTVCEDWNGYKVYQPFMSDGSTPCVGLPHFILEKSGSFRWTDEKECFEVLGFVYQQDE